MNRLLRDERGSLTARPDTDLGEPAWMAAVQRATPLVLALLWVAAIVLWATGVA